jgi:hypothetical protein
VKIKLFVLASILAYIAVVVFGAVLLSGCTCSGGVSFSSRSQAITSAVVYAVDYGVHCDGTSDDRSAIQSALDAGAGGVVRMPAGVCIVSCAPAEYYALSVPASTTFAGMGRSQTTIRMAAGIGPSVRLIEVETAGVTISDLGLDGAAAAQSEDEHRAGVFVIGATDLRIERVDAFNFTGDGFDLYAGSRIALVDVTAKGNLRDGVTCNPWTSVSDVEVSKSSFEGNLAQQIDFEPKGSGKCLRWDIHHNRLSPNASTCDYTLVIAGSGSATPSSDIMVASNVIDGSIQVAWASDVVVAHNTGTNSTPCMSSSNGCKTMVYRMVTRLSFVGNSFITTNGSSSIEITGSGTGQDATSIIVASNHLVSDASAGVVARGARSVYVVGNSITKSGPPISGSTAVYARSTNTTTSFDRVVAAENTAIGHDRGVMVSGNGSARLEMVLEDGNSWGPLYLDDGAGSLRLATVKSQVTRWPAGAVTKLQPGGSTTMERTP